MAGAVVGGCPDGLPAAVMVSVWGGFGPDHTVPSFNSSKGRTLTYLLICLLLSGAQGMAALKALAGANVEVSLFGSDVKVQKVK